MSRCSRGFLLVLGVIGGCSGTGDPEPAPRPEPYDGPPVQVFAGPPVRIEASVPTGGYELRVDSVASGRIELTLIEPGDGELVPQVLETLRATPQDVSPARPLQILVARERRGTQYFVPPPHRLAAVLER
jgi:hypothetical protein